MVLRAKKEEKRQENKKKQCYNHFFFFKFAQETKEVGENFIKFTLVYMELSVEDK